MEESALGFIGLGVMGGPMCANLTRRSGCPVWAYDRAEPSLQAAVEAGARRAGSVPELTSLAETVFLSLPSINEVEAVVAEILAAPGRVTTVVDMSTSDVNRTRQLARRCADAGLSLVDAPVARMRQAAVDGTLLITVGATAEEFVRLEPLLATMGQDVVHAGGSGSGQIFKIMNNMVLLLTMNALAEAMAIGRTAGVDGEALFKALALGSADSFALRTTAMRTLVPDTFPEKAFPTVYALKDLELAVRLAEETDVDARLARSTKELLERTRDAGHALEYYPVMIKMIDGRG